MEVSVSCLGGVGEIGMNMYVYETDKCCVIVDCGVKFARVDDPGIDLIIPDFSYINEISHKQILLLISHAHEDHIGAIPYLLKDFPDIALAANRYTFELINYKLKEFNINVDKIYIDENSPFEWGDFEITAYAVSHSIYDTFIFKLIMPDGFTFLHMSDYKIDFASPTGNNFPLKELVDTAKSGVNCLLADSTNSLVNGFTMGEYGIIENLDNIFSKSNGRIFFTSFASNVERLQTVFNLAKKYGRSVALEGSSLTKNIETARKYGRLKIDSNIIVPRKQIERMDDDKICIIATGSQGESGSVINKIAQNNFSNIRIRSTDLFIFSSRVIPGNEQTLIRVINNIYNNQGKCITGDFSPIHVSGHASKEDITMLIKLINPDYLVPIHGEMIHLIEHKNTALNAGLKEENILSFSSGKKLVFKDYHFIDTVDIPAEKMFVDTNRCEIIPFGELKKRRQLATEGAVTIFINKHDINSLNMDNIIIVYIGFNLNNNYDKLLKEALINIEEPFTIDNIAENIEHITKHFFKKRFNKKPVIKIIIH